MIRPRVLALIAVISLAACSFVCASPDPWPDYSAHTSYVDYVLVDPVNTQDTTWDFSLTVLSGSYEVGHGGVVGIKGLAVYPNGGNSEPDLEGWTSYAVFVREGWNDNGGWHTGQGAFGYLTGSPIYYISPGQNDQLIGTAQYPSGYTPPEQVFLVHIACKDGYTYWARPEVVPEPSSLLGLLAGAGALGALIRRRSS